MKKKITIESNNENLTNENKTEILTKNQLLDHIYQFKKTKTLNMYPKVGKKLEEIEDEITKSDEKNSYASEEHIASFEMLLLIVVNFDSEQDALAIMKSFFINLIRMVATKDDEDRKNLQIKCRELSGVYKITLENRFEYLGEDSLILAFLYDFVVNIQAHLNHLDSKVIDENSKEKSLDVSVDKIVKYKKQGDNFSQLILNIIEFFYVIVLLEKKHKEYVSGLTDNKQLIATNISELTAMIDEFFEDACNNLLDIHDSNIILMQEFYGYFMAIILEWREFLQTEMGLKIHFVFDDLPDFPNLEAYSRQPVFYENENHLISTNNKKVNPGNINSIGNGILALMQNLLNILAPPSKKDMTDDSYLPYKESVQPVSKLYFLSKMLDDLRSEETFCDSNENLLKYACLNPMLIYLRIWFENCQHPNFCEIIKTITVENEFNKINSTIKIEEECTSDDIKYLNYPFSFMRLLDQCLKMIMGHGNSGDKLFENNFLAQQTLAFLTQRTDKTFCEIMQNIYNLFYLHFQNKIVHFPSGLEVFKTEKIIVTWISEQFKTLLEPHETPKKNEGIEEFNPADVKKFINECAKIMSCFDKNENEDLVELIKYFKSMQEVMVNLAKSTSENYYKKNYPSLFGKDMQTLVRLLQNNALYKSNELMKNEHIIAVKHFVYRIIFQIVKRINFLEIKEKQKNEEDLKPNKNSTLQRNYKNNSSKNNCSDFALKLDKDSLFHHFLVVAAKDSENEALSEIINHGANAFVKLIYDKYIEKQYKDVEINIFKLDINAKVEKGNQSDSKAVRALLKDKYPAQYNALRNNLVEVDERAKINQSNDIVISSVSKNNKRSQNNNTNNNSKNSNNTKNNEIKSSVSGRETEKSNKKMPVTTPIKKEITKISISNSQPTKKINKQNDQNQSNNKSNSVGKKETSKIIGEKLAIDKKDNLTTGKVNDSRQQENHSLTVEIKKQPLLALENDLTGAPQKKDLMERIELQPLEKIKEVNSRERELEKQLELIKLQLREAKNENQKLNENKRQIVEDDCKLREQLKLVNNENQVLNERLKSTVEDNIKLKKQYELTSRENQNIKNQEGLTVKENGELKKQMILVNEKINQYQTDLQEERKNKMEVEQELKIISEKLQDSQKSLEEKEQIIKEQKIIIKQNQGTIVHQLDKIDRLQNSTISHNNENHYTQDNSHPNYNYVQTRFNQPHIKKSYKKHARTVYGNNHNRVWNQPRNTHTQPTPDVGQKGGYAPVPENK